MGDIHRRINYLEDSEFLNELDRMRVRVQYAKIILLDFQEKPVKSIVGNITQGNLTVNGASAIRRTISLTMKASPENSDIENLNNEISLNKKIKVEIGYKNPFPKYSHYGDIIWFKCGVFVISSATISRSTSAFNISIQGKDKMVMLDGSVGGTFPAAISLHESIDYPADEMHKPEKERNQIITHPTIQQIIFEVVHHFGKEDPSKIIINDIAEKAKLLVKYVGDSPVYFNNEYSAHTYIPNKEGYPNRFAYNQDAGYFQTDFTYPGELNCKAGDSVVSVLNKITQVLGNHEFFYDVDGNFIFQEKRNYLNTATKNIKDLELNDYVKQQLICEKYSLTDLETVNSINKSPKFDNIKNDFIVWGQRTTPAGAKIDIWYHLAIDQKPKIELANKFMYKKNKDKQILYEFFDEEQLNKELFSLPGEDGGWREELYRRALIANGSGDQYSDYDQELLAYWRTIYNPNNNNWKGTKGWNPIVENDPRQLNYWIDFIDGSDAINQYSVNMIGRRTKVVNDTNIKALYNTEVPDVIFIPYGEQMSEGSFSEGQQFFKLDTKLEELFVTSSTGISAFDKIRELLYLHLNYNTQISIQAVPKYYMEPNNIIYIADKESNIFGNFFITQFTLPLTYQGNMSITATQALNRV